MTTFQPALSGRDPLGSDHGPDDGLTAVERDALARASVTGQSAAAWIRALASRQDSPASRQVLERYADAVEQVLRREIIPGGDGRLAEELRHALDAYLLRGTGPDHRPALDAAERVSLLAVGFAALTAPLVVLSDIAGDLPPLCEAIDEALTVAAAPPTAGT